MFQPNDTVLIIRGLQQATAAPWIQRERSRLQSMKRCAPGAEPASALGFGNALLRTLLSPHCFIYSLNFYTRGAHIWHLVCLSHLKNTEHTVDKSSVNKPIIKPIMWKRPALHNLKADKQQNIIQDLGRSSSNPVCVLHLNGLSAAPSV